MKDRDQEQDVSGHVKINDRYMEINLSEPPQLNDINNYKINLNYQSGDNFSNMLEKQTSLEEKINSM